MKEFTPTEAAAIIDLPVRFVQKAIDEGPLGAARNGKGRALDLDDLVFLYVVGRIDSGFVRVSDSAKRQLRKKLGESLRAGTDLDIGGCIFQLKSAFRAVRKRLAKLRKAKQKVVSDPEIRGGMPVIKGTRIGAHEIAAMLEQETDEAEFLQDYPTLKPEDLEIAKIYAAAYPRRGRPPRHPWHIAAERRGEAAA
jgi:uncharacterized protein (DUF433 family)